MRSLFLLLLLATESGHAQSIENLVFEGAGIRGIAYAGVLEQMEKADLIKPVKNVAGAKAGREWEEKCGGIF